MRARIPTLISLLVLVALVALSGCKKEILRYPHSTAEGAAQAWADAFNRGEKGQLRLLVHPDRRALFDEHALDVEQQIRTFDIQRWAMGERVVVDGKLEGREITLFLADQAGVRENRAILVHTDGDWWLWKY